MSITKTDGFGDLILTEEEYQMINNLIFITDRWREFLSPEAYFGYIKLDAHKDRLTATNYVDSDIPF